MKRIIGLILLSTAFLCQDFEAQSQTYADGALIFSRTDRGGSARIQGMAGAQTALGGDVSSAQSNPAGLGMSNRSSFSFSLGFHNYSSSSEYLDNVTIEDKFTPNIPQLGAIFHQKGSEGSKYKGGSFAININRVDNYNLSNRASGVPDNSIIDYFLTDVDGLPLSAFDQGGSEYNSLTGLAWYTYLIDTIDGYYDSYILDYPERQSESTNVNGRHSQWSFSYGGNYDDMIFFGAGIGLTSFNYNSIKTFNESFAVTPESLLRDLRLSEYLTIDGTGINATLGLIVRPISQFQVGLSYTTPTRYNINDNWNAEIETIWTLNSYPGTGEILDDVYEETALIISDYALTAPSRLSVGTAVFLGKYGFITADYERIDYQNSRLSSRDFSMETDNDQINSEYGSTNNYRVGAELRYEIFRLRGGYSFRSSPLPSNDLFDASIQSVTGGVGIRTKSFFADVAIVNSITESGYFPYLINGAGAFSKTKTNIVNGILTVGFNF